MVDAPSIGSCACTWVYLILSSLCSKSYKEEYVREDTDLPDHLIKDVKGVTVFEQMHEQVGRISCIISDFYECVKDCHFSDRLSHVQSVTV